MSMQTANGGMRKQDFLASIVVFLVALPLCMGIAIACGVPPALGLITGIVGGIVVGSLSGCPLQVSGPAAGLTVLVWDLVQTQGLAVLGVVVMLAGAIQLAAGLLNIGRWFRAVSPAVIHGMLAGIGVLIAAGQFHVMLDQAPRGSGLPNLIGILPALTKAFVAVDSHLWAFCVGALTLSVLIAWKAVGLDKRLHMPGHLPAIIAGTAFAWFLQLPVNHVAVPHNLVSALSLPTLETLERLLESHVLLAALSLALIASAETLLSANAVDQLQQGQRTNYNQELRAQGIGNMICGFLGALPMTGVIARSTVNVEAGARTRWSAVLHGLWLLLVIVALPFVLELVPVASLAALLIFTGVKLVDLKIICTLRRYGKVEIGIYAATVLTIVATDLLTGVLVGMALALSKLVLTISHMKVAVTEDGAGQYTLRMAGSATFIGLPRLAEALDAVPDGSSLTVDFTRLAYIDHSCVEVLRSWEKRQANNGGKLNVQWDELLRRFESPASHN